MAASNDVHKIKEIQVFVTPNFAKHFAVLNDFRFKHDEKPRDKIAARRFTIIKYEMCT